MKATALLAVLALLALAQGRAADFFNTDQALADCAAVPDASAADAA